MKFEDCEFDSGEVGKLLHAILDEKKIIFVGLSSDPRDFSRLVYNEFLKHGYQLYAVNPKKPEIDDIEVYGSISEIEDEISSAYIIINPTKVLDAVKDCHEKDVKRIWLHRGEGKGSVSKEAIEYCLTNEIDVIPGACPFMFLNGGHSTNFFHGIHRWWLKRKDQIPLLVT